MNVGDFKINHRCGTSGVPNLNAVYGARFVRFYQLFPLFLPVAKRGNAQTAQQKPYTLPIRSLGPPLGNQQH